MMEFWFLFTYKVKFPNLFPHCFQRVRQVLFAFRLWRISPVFPTSLSMVLLFTTRIHLELILVHSVRNKPTYILFYMSLQLIFYFFNSIFFNVISYITNHRASLMAQMVKNLPAVQETQVQSLQKEMVTHSSTLAWRIPRTEEPGGL